MPNGNQVRTRSDRVAAVELPPGRWASFFGNVQRGPVLLRLAICAAVAIIIWAATGGWAPPLEFRLGEVPSRNVVARVDFSQVDEDATEEARKQARASATAVYDQNPQPLVELQSRVLNELSQLGGAESLESADQEIWARFRPELAEGTPKPTAEEEAKQFDQLKEALTADGATEKIQQALDNIFLPLQRQGVLEELPEEQLASSTSISVRQPDDKKWEQQVEINDVLLVNVRDQIQRQLDQEIPTLELASRLFARLRSDIPATLSLNQEETGKEREEAAELVDENPKMSEIAAGDVLADAGEPIGPDEFEKLQQEHTVRLSQLGWTEMATRSIAVFGMFVALYVLCGFYTFKIEPRVLMELSRFIGVMAALVLAVLLMKMTFGFIPQAEVIPLLLFGMTIAIAYSQPLALLLSAAVTILGVVSVGTDLSQAIVLMATVSGAIIALDSVRSRSKLLMVSFAAAAVAFLTNMGVGALGGDPFWATLQVAMRLALWSVIAGSLMTCILPLVERLYQVQTDLSLLELGDPAHPLLQELVRRAPGTYNHSINVASLAEAAAESIGARGLLVRVGAYFHDIGKMLKPGYFIENQSQGDNRHDALVPAMSTLVIIAHVKDGADLGRQNKLPEPIIDFIQQHHGTTLVEYFYRQATDRQENDPDAAEVDESSFRYPGPKPQTKEAGVLMIADAVESASRVLVEPTPARIESLVEDLSHKRLLDGQFDECGLTLEEVRKIGDSLVKSLTAVYHGRVKYPDQETA